MGWFVWDVLVNLVVLNLAAELVSTIRIDHFSISIFVSVVLTFVLDVIEYLEHKVKHFFCVEHGRQIIGAICMWLIVFSSKFLILWLDDAIFSKHIDLGYVLEIMVLSAVLMVSEKLSRIFYTKLGNWDRTQLQEDDDDEERSMV